MTHVSAHPQWSPHCPPRFLFLSFLGVLVCSGGDCAAVAWVAFVEHTLEQSHDLFEGPDLHQEHTF